MINWLSTGLALWLHTCWDQSDHISWFITGIFVLTGTYVILLELDWSGNTLVETFIVYKYKKKCKFVILHYLIQCMEFSVC